MQRLATKLLKSADLCGVGRGEPAAQFKEPSIGYSHAPYFVRTMYVVRRTTRPPEVSKIEFRILSAELGPRGRVAGARACTRHPGCAGIEGGRELDELGHRGRVADFRTNWGDAAVLLAPNWGHAAE